MKLKTILNKRIFVLIACLILIISTSVVFCSAVETPLEEEFEPFNGEVGRTITTTYDFFGVGRHTNGVCSNGNNFDSPISNIDEEDSIGFYGSSTVLDRWELKQYFDYDYHDNNFPCDIYSIKSSSNTAGNNVITVTLSNFYLFSNSRDHEDIVFSLEQFVNRLGFKTELSFGYRYYDLLDVDNQGDVLPIEEVGVYDISDNLDTEYFSKDYNIYGFIGDLDSDDHLLYFDYFTFRVDTGHMDAGESHTVNLTVTYKLLPEVNFYYNNTSYKLIVQSDFDNFQFEQFTGWYLDTYPSFYLRSYTDWIATAIGGFFSFQLFPGFYLGGILVVIVAFSLVMWWLKMFGGG